MKHGDSQSQQKGFALVLSLLILLVMMVLGVAALNSTIMQERMAGNARTQADVFETSSEGVTRSLELFYSNAEDFTFGEYNLSCGQVFGTTLPNQNAQAWAYPIDPDSWHLASGDDDNPRLEQRMYCCRNWEEVDDGAGGTVWVESPSKLYALNRATFMGGADNTQSLALREIEVEMAEAEPDDPTCAICAPGEINSVDGSNSRQFIVNGACGAAVVTDSVVDAGEFIQGIPGNRIGNYTGGIVGGRMAKPWDSPAELAEFVFWAKLGIGLDVPGQYFDGDFSDSGGTVYGSFTDPGNPPRIIYIDGNATFGGNISGAGILIVREKLTWGGTPDFDGLIIALGGFATNGAGKGEPNGSIVITDLDYINPPYPDDPLYRREVLHYEVARDNPAQEVKMYIPGNYPNNSNVRRADGAGFSPPGTDAVPSRPILVAIHADFSTSEVIHYDAGTPGDISDDRFFWATGADAGSEVERPDPTDPTAPPWVNADGDFILNDPDTGLSTVIVPFESLPTRDAYGRLIPDFVQVDNYPEVYGYHPNEWGWDPDDADAKFAWGSTDIDWSGGGKGAITYDCRMLQRVRHRLMCMQPLQDLPSDPDDGFYQDPESQYGDYCWHSVAGVEGGTGGAIDGKYFEDYVTPPGPPTADRPENQHAWHMWRPSCDCLGISVNTDMIIAGWRENLGWRDDEEFLGCSGLPSPSGT